MTHMTQKSASVNLLKSRALVTLTPEISSIIATLLKALIFPKICVLKFLFVTETGEKLESTRRAVQWLNDQQRGAEV